MEIKFWGKNKNEYDEYFSYVLDKYLKVYCIDRTNTIYDEKNIEPHFYLSGERVA